MHPPLEKRTAGGKGQWEKHGGPRGEWRLGSSARKLKSMGKTTRELGSKEYSNADQEFSELAREKMWSRIHLIPVLQAEEDRDLVRRHWAQEAREKELLGAETKVYNNDRCVLALCCRTGIVQNVRATNNGDRFVRPTYAVTPSETSK
jgi:NADH dehydrogenase (ubiquinone) 1 alpha subcomplex subunit 13